MEKEKESGEIRIGIELTIKVSENGKPPMVTFHAKVPKKKPSLRDF